MTSESTDDRTGADSSCAGVRSRGKQKVPRSAASSCWHAVLLTGGYDTSAAYFGLINEATAVANARSVSVTLPL